MHPFRSTNPFQYRLLPHVEETNHQFQTLIYLTVKEIVNLRSWTTTCEEKLCASLALDGSTLPCTKSNSALRLVRGTPVLNGGRFVR